MEIIEPNFYFAVGMGKGELLRPYDPAFSKKRVKAFHHWLKTKNHFSVGDSLDISLDSEKYIRPFFEAKVSCLGVCGAYEDLCVTSLTLSLLDFRFKVYVPKEYVFRSKYSKNDLLDRLLMNNVFLNPPEFCSKSDGADLNAFMSHTSPEPKHFLKKIKNFSGKFEPNFKDLVSWYEDKNCFYFLRKD